MKFQRGQDIKAALRIGAEANSVRITRIHHSAFGKESFSRIYMEKIMGDLTNPDFQNFHMFYKVPFQEEDKNLPKDFEMTTQIKYLPNSKEDVLMFYNGKYYSIPYRVNS